MEVVLQKQDAIAHSRSKLNILKIIKTPRVKLQWCQLAGRALERFSRVNVLQLWRTTISWHVHSKHTKSSQTDMCPKCSQKTCDKSGRYTKSVLKLYKSIVSINSICLKVSLYVSLISFTNLWCHRTPILIRMIPSFPTHHSQHHGSQHISIIQDLRMNSTNCLTIIILGCYSHMAILKAQGFHGRLEARVGDEGRPGRCFCISATKNSRSPWRSMKGSKNFDGTYCEDIMKISWCNQLQFLRA